MGTRIGDFDTSTTLCEDYLKGRDGAPVRFIQYLQNDQRLGQAFYNALSDKDRRRINATPFDPFFANDKETVHAAIEFLLDTE